MTRSQAPGSWSLERDERRGGVEVDWNGRGSLSGNFTKSFYHRRQREDERGRPPGYRLRRAQPRVAADYGLTWSDFTKGSTSYFTPLGSIRHAARPRGLRLLREGRLRLRRAVYEFSF